MKTAIVAAWAIAALAPAAPMQPQAVEVAFVANAEAATISLVDVAAGSVIGALDVNPEKTSANRTGTQNFAQDTDLSPDGRTLYVSRGYLGDVAAFDLESGRMLWKARVDPVRSDHMVITRDGKSLFVSALTANRVVRLNTTSGAETGRVVSGVYPHDNQISKDGKTILNASLGNMGTPIAQRDNVAAPSDQSGYAYQITVIDAATLEVKERIRTPRGVRPFHLTPNEKAFYAQTHGAHSVLTYDLGRKVIVRELQLPVKAGVSSADFEFEAPHHGLAITPNGRTLCLAGRASDYAGLVRAPKLSLIATIPVGDGPSWAEFASKGRLCLLPNSRSDDLSVISVAERREVARIKVGDGPKHITVASVPRRVVDAVASRTR